MDEYIPNGERSVSTASKGFFRSVAFRGRGGDVGDVDNEKGPVGLTTLHNSGGRVVADLVFIHGLGGGSRKTWTKNEDPRLFWPQEWLPQDDDFKDVRIHTFGYDANYGKESILNIHDFAKNLIGWLHDCPAIPREEQSPIVLVCHSLGGLIAKRAYVLSRQSKEYFDLSERIVAMFFLATPHRGSNMAETLSRILQVSGGSRPFVADLHPNSVMIESINDEFPNYCQTLQLHSFYETTPMSFGVKKSIIVPKDSAVLGYTNERSSFLTNANHREVCKFSSVQDPNYLAVRNSIASIINELRGSQQTVSPIVDYAQLLWLKEKLDVDDSYDDDFHRIDSERIPDSCTWIAQTEAFQRWRDLPAAQMYWLTAKAGTGKSIISGYVISQLKSQNKDCVMYFFNYGDKSKFGIDKFLRTIAWQMACQNETIFAHLVKQFQKDAHLRVADYRTVWRKLFLDGILRLKVSTRYYLLIDALDECRNEAEILPLLVKAAEVNALRIFLTSRKSFESYGTSRPATLKIVQETVPIDRTTADIKLYIYANLHSLPTFGADQEKARSLMIDSIMRKASGCFLWVRLVLSEMRTVHTADEVREVLEDVPSDMDSLYSRILESMSSLKRGKALTKAILAWVTCSVRPLKIEELHEALELDVGDNIVSVRRSIASTCGQLVYVDSSSRVQLIHQTARDFLLRADNMSEFAMERKEGHRRLAMVCLKYLCSSKMAGPKPRKLSATSKAGDNDRSPFLAYAGNALPNHIAMVSSEDDPFFFALARFLASPNVLSWIEYISKSSDLNRLIETGKAIRQYLQRRASHVVPLGKDTKLLESWSIDLVRLVTKFGRNLAASPSAIYHLIPPFCPPESALNQQFGASNRSITVKGLTASAWDDCASVINYQRENPTAIACSPSIFAVGQKSGKIKIHHETSCQELRTLLSDEPIKLLRFGETGDYLAALTLKYICVWNTRSWEIARQFSIETPCMDVSFADNDQMLLAVSRDNCLLAWDLLTGDCRQLRTWVDELDEEYTGDRPAAATISNDSTMVAVVYRGQDIIVWDVEYESVHDIYEQVSGSLGPRAKKRSARAFVRTLLFSRASESGLLAASYMDGELVVFNTIDRKIQARTSANAHSLVSSPNGLMMACGNSAGMILLFEFETLKLFYRIVSEEYSIKALVFTADNHRLIDIRGPYCRVWEPSALFRDTLEEDDNSDTLSISTMPQEYTIEDTQQVIHISALFCAEEEKLIVCGKVDGSICQYDVETGAQNQVLIKDGQDSAIIDLFYSSHSKLLTSADIDSRTVSYQLSNNAAAWHAEKVFEHRAGDSIVQVLTNNEGTRLLVSTHTSDTLFGINDDGERTIASISWPTRHRYRWSSHATDPSRILLIQDHATHIFEWQNMKRLTPKVGIRMKGSTLGDFSIRAIMPCFNGQVIATTFSESLASRAKSKIFLWNTFEITAETESIAPIPRYEAIAQHVECIIGSFGHRIAFLHQDGWVCSADAQSFEVDSFDRHFFFPGDWLSATGPDGSLILGIFSRTGTIVFVQRNEVAIVHKGMEYFEAGQSKGTGKRPGLGRTVKSDPLPDSKLPFTLQ